MILDKNKELIFSHKNQGRYNISELDVYKVGEYYNICINTTVPPSGERMLMITLDKEELKRFIDEVGLVIL